MDWICGSDWTDRGRPGVAGLGRQGLDVLAGAEKHLDGFLGPD
jgi:hypothetical protein